MTTKFGFKEITPSNWLEPDDVLKGFVRMSPDGELRSITGDDYLCDVLRPELLESVPTDVQALFEVARGAMVYMATSSIHFIPLLHSNCFGFAKRQ